MLVALCVNSKCLLPRCKVWEEKKRACAVKESVNVQWAEKAETPAVIMLDELESKGLVTVCSVQASPNKHTAPKFPGGM